MIQWLGEQGIPFVLAFTKCDKLKQPKVDSHIAAMRRELKKTWQKLPEIFMTSSETYLGREALLSFIDGVNARWK